MLDFLLDNEYFHSVLISICCGAIVGLEREYKNKSAGFRTVILICFGATIFTIASRLGNLSDDRIAANIVTGIGFLGAGVIYQGRFSVQGLTTAAVIWTMAAIGMLVGFGQHLVGISLAVVMVVILSLFQKIETLLASIFLTRTLHITFKDNSIEHLRAFEQFLKTHQVEAVRKGMEKDDNRLEVVFEVSGKKQKVRILNESIIQLEYVYAFSNM
ncbi:MgtC/SapB family protein [Sphingobacterium bovistauri]|uniref:MgtC/SapB family protein n=1 Tax=Sphingobacterium bovistauri TaxID=2781959 RepID=A0ABS7Z3U7_9SPHI|nr:MgtC/SapB family protein [Sphingobacterium bovistauri]MCA5004828.1 MgtC/SapB family protein [Sphingobacterium bovistauri]